MARRKALPASRPKNDTPNPANHDPFSAFALEEAEDNRILKASMWFAAVVHTLVLLINFPTLHKPPTAEPDERIIHAYVMKRYQPPPPRPPEQIPPKRVKRTPVPDPTPHDPEPIRLDEPQTEVDLPELDEDFFQIPDAPPAPPEPVGPIMVSGEVTPPEKVHSPQPAYTEIARRARIQGTVVVQAVIDKKGEVTQIKVLKQLPMGLTEAAVSAMRQWKFKPATLRGKPVDVYYNLTVTFRLQ